MVFEYWPAAVADSEYRTANSSNPGTVASSDKSLLIFRLRRELSRMELANSEQRACSPLTNNQTTDNKQRRTLLHPYHPLQQHVVGQHQGRHGFYDRHGPGHHAGVVSPLAFHHDRLPCFID